MFLSDFILTYDIDINIILYNVHTKGLTEN